MDRLLHVAYMVPFPPNIDARLPQEVAVAERHGLDVVLQDHVSQARRHLISAAKGWLAISKERPSQSGSIDALVTYNLQSVSPGSS